MGWMNGMDGDVYQNLFCVFLGMIIIITIWGCEVS